MRQIVSLLNRRFKHRMEEDATRFDEEMTQQYWEYMEATNHEILRWARGLRPGTRKRERVERWAEEQEIR